MNSATMIDEKAGKLSGAPQNLARRAWRVIAPLAVVALTAGVVDSKLALVS